MESINKIQPGIGYGFIKIGSTMKEIDTILLKYYGVSLWDCLRDGEYWCVTNELRLFFNPVTNLLCEIELTNSTKYKYLNLALGDEIIEIKKKVELIESDLEDILFYIKNVDGLLLEFNHSSWLLESFTVFNEAYCIIS